MWVSRAAYPVAHREPEISIDFSEAVIPVADPIFEFFGPRTTPVIHLAYTKHGRRVPAFGFRDNRRKRAQLFLIVK